MMPTPQSRSPLGCVAIHPNVEAVKELLSMVRIRTSLRQRGATPPIDAIPTNIKDNVESHEETGKQTPRCGVKPLLEYGANPNIGDKDGETPPHWAAIECRLEALRFFSVRARMLPLSSRTRWGRIGMRSRLIAGSGS